VVYFAERHQAFLDQRGADFAVAGGQEQGDIVHRGAVRDLGIGGSTIAANACRRFVKRRRVGRKSPLVFFQLVPGVRAGALELVQGANSVR